MGKTRIRPKVEETEFINLKLAGDQFNINANTEVEFVEESSSGLSVSSNRVTLKAGVTYVLSASLRHNGNAASTSANYTWRDYTNSVNLGKEMHILSSNFVTDDGSQTNATFVLKPATDISVGVRCVLVNAANQGIFVDTTQASIYSI